MDKISIVAIYFSKKKIILFLLASIAFVGIGAWFIIDPPPVRVLMMESPGELAVLGYITAIFFGVIAVFMIKKLFDNRPAIIIDDEAIDDRSSMFPAGYVVWKDIKSVAVIDVKGQTMIALVLYDPEPYLQTRSALAKKTLSMNYRLCGAHFAISANGLDIDTNTLFQMLNEKVAASKR